MFKKFVIKNDDSQVEEFKLKEFSLRVTEEAEAFEKSELINTKGFVIDKSSSKKSGLSYLKDKRITNKINEEVKQLLEKEKAEIYEKYKTQGYEEGYQAGIQAGTESVVEDCKVAVEGSLLVLENVTKELVQMNESLIKENESDLVNLIKLATEKFCLKEISLNDSLIKNLISQTLEEHVKENKIKCFLSGSDYKNLSKFNEEIKINSLPQEIVFEASDQVSDGGLILQLENGRIDKNIATRFNKIWGALSIDGK